MDFFLSNPISVEIACFLVFLQKCVYSLKLCCLVKFLNDVMVNLFFMRPLQPVFLLLFLFIIASCSSTRQNAETEGSSDHPLVITADNAFKRKAPVRIVARNTSSQDTVQLYKPRNLIVEKKKEDRWVRIRTLYCPCGASCPAPPQKRPLYPGMTYTYRWDQMEEWCGEMTPEGIPEMHRQFPGFGQYRVAIRIFKQAEGKVDTLYQSFNIKK